MRVSSSLNPPPEESALVEQASIGGFSSRARRMLRYENYCHNFINYIYL